MKIIHCADLHLDSKMTSNLSKEKAKERKAELLHTFLSMIKYACDNQVQAIIIAGDLFDTKIVSATARNAVYKAILQNSDIIFYYLRGNHDASNFLSNLEEIPCNLKLFGNEWTTYMDFANNITISGIEMTKDNRGFIYNSLVLENDKFNIIVMHGQEVENISKDADEVIAIKELRYKGIDYLALGHIHSYKQIDLDSRGKYCYPGCLEGRGFDECGKHGFVLLDINDNNKQYTSEFIEIAKRNLYNVEVDITDCFDTIDISKRIDKSLSNEKYKKRDLIKVVLNGKVDIDCDINIEFLIKKYEDKFYFIKIYNCSTLKVDYNLYLLDESLKGEFVRTVMSVKDLTEEEKATIVRFGIQALSGEELQ